MQSSRRNKETERKLKDMLLNYECLDNVVASSMRRFGLKTRSKAFSSTKTDPEVLLFLNEAMKIRYEQIIKELIQISRTQNA